MVPKGLLGGVIGFLIGGLLVSSAVTYLEQPSAENHNRLTTVKLEKLRGDAFDKAFIEEMIVHHQGAVEMAELAEKNASHEEIKKLSREIIKAQSQEIDMMQSWQVDWGYKAVPKSHKSH